MAFTISAATLSRLVVAHDCNDADVESLNEAYVGKSEGEISDGLRWYYCAGLGIALGCMGMFGPLRRLTDWSVQRCKYSEAELHQESYRRQTSTKKSKERESANRTDWQFDLPWP